MEQQQQQQRHVFFQNIGQQRGPQGPPPDPTYEHNILVFEMASNWPFVRWLMCRYREGWLKNMTPMEQEWMNFITKNGIDVEKDKDPDKFVEEYYKEATT